MRARREPTTGCGPAPHLVLGPLPVVGSKRCHSLENVGVSGSAVSVAVRSKGSLVGLGPGSTLVPYVSEPSLNRPESLRSSLSVGA